jgi:gamma-glutamyl:cysteine ligase YbdK (ATP-grasp superfamily)
MSFSALDLLARIQLEARRRRVELRLRNVSPALRELIAFAGLEEALRVELERQPDEREERVDLQEEGQLGDTAG